MTVMIFFLKVNKRVTVARIVKKKLITADYLVPFCDRESAKSTAKSAGWGRVGWVGCGQGDLPSLPDFFPCYAFERMDTSPMTHTERNGKKCCFYVSCTKCKCEDSNDGAFRGLTARTP